MTARFWVRRKRHQAGTQAAGEQLEGGQTEGEEGEEGERLGKWGKSLGRLGRLELGRTWEVGLGRGLEKVWEA